MFTKLAQRSRLPNKIDLVDIMFTEPTLWTWVCLAHSFKHNAECSKFIDQWQTAADNYLLLKLIYHNTSVHHDYKWWLRVILPVTDYLNGVFVFIWSSCCDILNIFIIIFVSLQWDKIREDTSKSYLICLCPLCTMPLNLKQ